MRLDEVVEVPDPTTDPYTDAQQTVQFVREMFPVKVPPPSKIPREPDVRDAAGAQSTIERSHAL
jgi:hypothetical protein